MLIRKCLGKKLSSREAGTEHHATEGRWLQSVSIQPANLEVSELLW